VLAGLEDEAKARVLQGRVTSAHTRGTAIWGSMQAGVAAVDMSREAVVVLAVDSQTSGWVSGSDAAGGTSQGSWGQCAWPRHGAGECP
jgi:hypothetical protein